MKYRITLEITVDPDANFIGCDEDWVNEELRELITISMYDIDDITLDQMEVEEID